VALVVACGGQSASDTPAPETTALPANPAATSEPTPGPTPTPARRWSVATVPEGWTTGLNFPRVTVIVHEDDQTNLTIATDLSGADGTPLDPGADAFVAYLESVDGLETSPRKDVELGGNAAIQLDVRAAADIPELFHIGPIDGPDGYALGKGQPARIWALDPGDATVVIVVEPAAGNELQPSVKAAQPVIDSIVFK
jgi:hypothetical protein